MAYNAPAGSESLSAPWHYQESENRMFCEQVPFYNEDGDVAFFVLCEGYIDHDNWLIIENWDKDQISDIDLLKEEILNFIYHDRIHDIEGVKIW